MTDANVLLGRVQPGHFPRVFGASGDEPLDPAVTGRLFGDLAASTPATAAATRYFQTASNTCSAPRPSDALHTRVRGW